MQADWPGWQAQVRPLRRLTSLVQEVLCLGESAKQINSLASCVCCCDLRFWSKFRAQSLYLSTQEEASFQSTELTPGKAGRGLQPKNGPKTLGIIREFKDQRATFLFPLINSFLVLFFPPKISLPWKETPGLRFAPETGPSPESGCKQACPETGLSVTPH